MSSITQTHNGKHTYLYESFSYRDKISGKSLNKKVLIGKIDPITGQTIFKKDFIAKQKEENKELPTIINNKPHKIINDINNNVNNFIDDDILINPLTFEGHKNYGVFYFLSEIAKKIGLWNIIEETMPNICNSVFALTSFLIASDRAVMYAENWLKSTDGFNVKNLSSQRISDLLTAFDANETNKIFRSWHNIRREKEYIALDTTSVSTYSKKINTAEKGYNRDHENLSQVNMCLLFGLESKLPIYETMYYGSLNDVSTLECTLEELFGLGQYKNIFIIMDKGFFSIDNLNLFLDNPGRSFLICVPFTNKFTIELIESVRQEINTATNTVITKTKNSIRGVKKIYHWGKNKTPLYAHIFFNPYKELSDQDKLFSKIKCLEKTICDGKITKKNLKLVEHYFEFNQSKCTSRIKTAKIREDVLKQELLTSGWFVLLSNKIDDTQQAHDLYRIKDGVEKAFLKFKRRLNFKRFRVHSDNRMENKSFIGFIALILYSHIEKIMVENNLQFKMTFRELIDCISKIQSFYSSGIRKIRPLTKEVKDILTIFNIENPK
jgi:transposase